MAPIAQIFYMETLTQADLSVSIMYIADNDQWTRDCAVVVTNII